MEVVSTLLEIQQIVNEWKKAGRKVCNVSTLLEIQRFRTREEKHLSTGRQFQPFLRFNMRFSDKAWRAHAETMFQPFLRFNVTASVEVEGDIDTMRFQPFLRFNGSCVWLLWVFKFFFGFL